ncbi:MAG: biotin transporter BioY [Syntrophomonadaceae bacterium]|nr:biotin transporter BioY [Syntrophomonadaceae bacterium]
MKTRELAYAAMFTAVIAASAILTRIIPVAVVPFSLQSLLVFLAGGLLNKRTAALSMVAYVLLGLIGIPVFASPPYGGLGYLLVPSFGFLLGFILTAWLVAWCLERWGNTVMAHVVSVALGIGAMYLVGLPYIYGVLNFYLGQAVDVAYIVKIGFIPFIGFDLLKAGVAAGISFQVRKRMLL